MIGGIDSSPVLFAQPLELENRKRFWCLKRVAEEMRNFLCDGTMLTPCPSLKLLVQGVGKIFDVKDRHALPPKLLQYGGTGRQRQAGHSPAPKMVGYVILAAIGIPHANYCRSKSWTKA